MVVGLLDKNVLDGFFDRALEEVHDLGHDVGVHAVVQLAHGLCGSFDPVLALHPQIEIDVIEVPL